MNIFLVPYNWTRHVVVSLVIGGFALLAWWLYVLTSIGLGPWLFDNNLLWIQKMEG